MRRFLKSILRPIAVVFTKLFFDVDTVKGSLKKVYWEESNAFKWASSYVVKNQISGDYVEFGVYKGKSFIEMFRQIKVSSESFYKIGLRSKNVKNIFEEMKFHAFDSFEGLPDSSADKPIQYFSGNYSASQNLFLDSIKKGGVDLNRVTITKGFFDESLNSECSKRIKLKEISIAYIDCDLYDSTLYALDFITPFIKNGTVLIFDDWFRNRGDKRKGVQGAVINWLNKNNNIVLQHYHNSDTRTATFITSKNETNFKINQIDCV